MEEGEGGRLNIASVCLGEGAQRSDLLLQCGGQNLLSLRVMLGEAQDFPPDGNPDFSTPLRLTVDGRAFDRPSRYEAMDGAMVTEFPFDAQIVGALQAGRSVSVSFPETGFMPMAFPLKGSGTAIAWLVEACGRQ